ncbi:MAG TPA: pirin family protein [Thermoanaerobaculia bacterium]
MSTQTAPPEPNACTGEDCAAATFETFPAHRTRLNELEIRRALPRSKRRLVGPWCFLDRYGPVSFTDSKPMDVAPHPHIGLQTVSWLLEGEVLHRDTLGFESVVRPGELNLMTSGNGIAHAEETPRGHSGRLSGVQLWVALPEAVRERAPSFAHHVDLPSLDIDDATLTLFMGQAAGQRSPATAYSPMVGADIALRSRAALPLERTFEHALFLLDGEAQLDGETLVPDVLYYLGTQRDELPLSSRDGARILLLGGAPFGETVLMWWNFVARTHEELVAARDEWQAHSSRFGDVAGYDGPRLDAPPLKGRVGANPAS